MIDEIAYSLQMSSRKLSILGQNELSQHQECAIQAIGFAKINEQQVFVFSDEEIKLLDTSKSLTSKQVQSAFLDSDVLISFSEDRAKGVILFAVESEEMFEGVPVFWQNYLITDLLPAVFLICVERVEIEPDFWQLLAIPYFSIMSTNLDLPVQSLAFVGESIREKVVSDAGQAELDGMSNVQEFLGLVVATLKKSMGN